MFFFSIKTFQEALTLFVLRRNQNKTTSKIKRIKRKQRLKKKGCVGEVMLLGILGKSS